MVGLIVESFQYRTAGGHFGVKSNPAGRFGAARSGARPDKERLCPSLNQPPLAALEPHRGENPARIGGPVDPDSLRPDLDVGGDAMAVHDDLLERAAMIEEVVADPTQVADLLLGGGG